MEDDLTSFAVVSVSAVLHLWAKRHNVISCGCATQQSSDISALHCLLKQIFPDQTLKLLCCGVWQWFRKEPASHPPTPLGVKVVQHWVGLFIA